MGGGGGVHKLVSYCGPVAFPVPQTRGVVCWSSSGHHSEVHGKGSRINEFIRIRLSRLFATLAVKTKKNAIVKVLRNRKTTNSRRKKTKGKNTWNFTSVTYV